MKNISGFLDQRDIMKETSGSDSDSADNLFLTQSVTSASRTVKRRRPSDTQFCPFGQQSEDEQKTSHHRDPTVTSSSDSETTFAELHRRWRSPRRTPGGGISRQRRPRHRNVPKIIELPFLKHEKVSVPKNNKIVNSEIGGFFRCLQKLSKGHGERGRRELSPSMLPSDSEQKNSEDNDEYEDIRKVNIDRFIYGTNKRNRQKWLPLLKRQTRQKATKYPKSHDHQVKPFQTRKKAGDPVESQDSMDTPEESSSSSIEEPRSEKKGGPTSSSTRSSLRLRSTPSRPCGAKSPFVKSLFPDSPEKDIENRPQVLVQCSQSQSLNWHRTQKTDKACKKLADEMTVEETQWPSSDNQDEDETQILENDHTDESGEEFGSGSGFLSSQDLFDEPDYQASPSKARCFYQERNEKDKMILGDISEAHEHSSILESRVVLHDIMKQRNVRCSSILADMKGDAKCFRKWCQISPENKEKDKKTSDVEHVPPSTFKSCVVLHDILKDDHSESQTSPLGKISPTAGNKHQEKDNETSDDLGVKDLLPFTSKSCVVLNDIMKDTHGKYSESQTSPLSEISPTAGNKHQEKDKETSDDLGVKDLLPFTFESCVVLNDIMKDDHGKYSESRTSPSSEVSPTVGNKHQEKDKKTSDDLGVKDLLPFTSKSCVVSHGLLKDDHSESQTTPSSEVSPTAGDKHQEKDKETSDDLSVEHLLPSTSKSCVVLNDVMKDNHGKYSKSQTSPSSEVSPMAGDKHQEKDKETSDDLGVTHVHSTSPLKHSTTGNNYESPVKDVLRVGQREKSDSPLFNYGTMTFLKRKKGEKTGPPGSADNPPPIQADPDHNKGSAPHIDDTISPKTSRNVQMDEMSEKPTGTLPDVSAPGEIIKGGASLSGSKPKNLSKEGKNNGLLVEPVEMSVIANPVQSVQDVSVVCPSVDKKKRKKDKNDQLLEEPHDLMHETNASEDITTVLDSLVDGVSVGSKPKQKRKKDKRGEPVSDGSQLTGEEAIQMPCQGPSPLWPITKETKQLTGNDHSSREVNQLDSHTQAHGDGVQCDGLEPRQKKKKKKKIRDSSPGMADTSVASQSSEEMSVSAHSLVNSASVGGHKAKKKRKKDELYQEPVQEINVSADTGLPMKAFSVDCALVGGSERGKKAKKYKMYEWLSEPGEIFQQISISADSTPSVPDPVVEGTSVGGSKPKKKKKKDKNVGSIEEPVQEMSLSEDTVLPVEDFSVDCASAGGRKPKKKKKKNKNNEWSVEPVDILQQIGISADSTSLLVVESASGGESKPKKKRKKDRSAEPEEEAATPFSCQGSVSLVSVNEETEQLIGSAFNHHTPVSHVQSGGLEPPRKKKKKRKDSSPELAYTSQYSEESCLSQATKTIKKKKRKFVDDVGEGQVDEVPIASRSLEEPSDKSLDAPADVEIQPTNDVDLINDESVTGRKKKKKKRRAAMEENVDDEASPVVIHEPVQTPEAEQQAAEVVQETKVKKQKKKKKDRPEEAADTSLFLGPELEDTPRSNAPSETGRTGQEEGLAKSKSVKKKKKRKELESDGCLVSSSWEYDSCRPEIPLTNDWNEGKKRETAKSDWSGTSQVLQAEDTILVKRKKKKKKSLLTPDIDMCPEIHDIFQENDFPSDISEAITKKKKKKRKDKVDRDEQ